MRGSTRSSCSLAVLVWTVVVVVAAGCGRSGESEAGTQGPASGGPAAASSPGSVSLEQPVPQFSKATLAGDTLSTGDLSGKITLVNFWATWCGPCVVEMPELIGLRAEWRDRPFEIVGVSMDQEGFEIVEPFAEDFGVNYPLILDAGPLADAFGGVYGLPTTFIVDGAGMVVHRYVGLFPFDDVRDELERMVSELES